MDQGLIHAPRLVIETSTEDDVRHNENTTVKEEHNLRNLKQWRLSGDLII